MGLNIILYYSSFFSLVLTHNRYLNIILTIELLFIKILFGAFFLSITVYLQITIIIVGRIINYINGFIYI